MSIPLVGRLVALLATTLTLAPLAAQVDISPIGGTPDPKILLVNSTGNTGTFTITNASTTQDHQYTGTCTGGGNVTITICPHIGIIAALQTVTKNVTFAVGAAGAGTVQLSLTSTTGGGSTVGSFTTTTVAPSATWSPTGTTVQVAPNRTGLTQAFAVTNTSRGAGTFSLVTACSGSGVSGCIVSPATIFLDSAGVAASSGTVTMTYNSLANPNNIGTVGATLRFAGADVSTGSATVHVMSATVTPVTQTVSAGPSQAGVPFQFTVENTGPSSTTYNLDLPTCTVVLNCRFSPSGTTKNIMVTPGPANAQAVVVLYDTPASGTGTLAMRANFATVALSNGTLTINMTAAPTVTAVSTPTFVGPSATGQQQQFTVTNPGPSATFTFSHNCATMPAPAAATGCSVSPSSQSLTTNVPATVTVTFTGGATKGVQSTMTLTATATGVPTGSGSATIVVPNPVITAPSAVIVGPNTTGTLSTFTVVNQPPLTTPYYFTAACSGTVTTCSMSSGATGTLIVNNNPPHSAVVSFNTGSTLGAGTVTLQARVQSAAGPIVSTANQSITVSAPQVAMTLDVPGAAVDSLLYRGQCIAAALGQAAATECGDLRVVHPLPAVRTMNTWRTPTLVYSSTHARPWINVPFNATLPTGTAVPTTVSAVVLINAVQRGATHSWTGAQWAAATTRRLTVGFDASVSPTLPTGVYTYTLQVTNTFATGAPQTASRTGKLVVVDRRASSFGAGWWLAGLEKLDLTVPTLLRWYGGDGSVRQYTQLNATTWGAPTMTYPDEVKLVAGEYIRKLPDSVWVYFDAQGRHTKTRNRLGHVTTFGYDASNRLSTITLPPATAPLTYTFNYDANNHLATVIAPGDPSARTVTVTAVAATGRITSILDPGSPTRTIGFGYGADHRITSRTSANGGVTSFWYDAASKVKADTLVLASGAKIGHSITSLQSFGVNGSTALVDPSLVKFRIDGPRTVNTVSFAVNNSGAPTQITDAAGQNTTMGRTVSGFPGLVNTLTTVLGFTITATYDTKGRIKTSAQISSTGVMATTLYDWHTGWDQLTKVTNPEGDLVEFGIDAAGNRQWQQDGRGAVSRTTFGYNANNQLQSVTLPLSNPEEFYYDAKGNLYQHYSAQDMLTTTTNDAIGRTFTISRPTGLGPQQVPPSPAWGPYEVTTLTYSDRNQELTRSTALSGESTSITNGYDAEGNLTSVSRTWAPNQAGVGAQATSYLYDYANRQYRQTEPGGTYEQRGFDEAGNVTSVLTRRGYTITMGYNNLNRMTSRSVPAVSFGAPLYPTSSSITPIYQATQGPYAWSRPAESQGFGYTADGQISSATALDADVSRGFFPNGQVQSETQTIKTLSRTGTAHVYTVTYTYDKNGRRTTLTLGPGSLFTGSAMTYAYHPQWGGLTSIADIAQNTFNFSYNDASVLTGISYPGGVSEALGYDGDWRLTSDAISRTGSLVFPSMGTNTVRSFTVAKRNARGQIIQANDAATTIAGFPTTTLTGLGHLATAYLLQKQLPTVTGYQATFESSDTYVYNGLGDIISSTEGWGFSSSGGAATANVRQVTNTYNGVNRLTSRVTSQGTTITTTTYTHDAGGNVVFESSNKGGIDPITDERASYYGPDDKLVAVDHRTVGRKQVEEFRYDALGRRVWVRFIPTGCGGGNGTIDCITPSTRRTIWDGTQEVAEISAVADTTNLATEELDFGWPLQNYQAVAGLAYGDPNPHYGRVVYSPGLAVDQPMSVTRYEYRDRPTQAAAGLTWPRFSIMVFWDYRGGPAFWALYRWDLGEAVHAGRRPDQLSALRHPAAVRAAAMAVCAKRL